MNQIWPVNKQGLYDPQFEHDACGIAMLANIKGFKSRYIVEQALTALERLDHRGGRGSDECLGDGAGIMTELPHALFQAEWQRKGKTLPELGKYGVGMFFLPKKSNAQKRCEEIIANILKGENLQVFGWRTVPTNDQTLNKEAKETAPVIRQIFVFSPYNEADDIHIERKLYQVRRQIEKALKQLRLTEAESCYIASFSARTIVYKGLLLPKQLKTYYCDLSRKEYESAMAMVHNRFSTNTFPSWNRAQPNRFSMHNGEINTINGNIHWMHAREGSFHSDYLPNMKHLSPVIDVSGSDSAIFDNVLEFLVRSGWKLPHAMMMMIPEPWQKSQLMETSKKAFYQYHSSLMEPWDGPAAMVFTDGRQIGACLDRNGLRPARFVITADDFIYFSSETGVVDLPEEKIIRKDRLKPGHMLLVDLQKGRLFLDDEIKKDIISDQPYKDWIEQSIVPIEDLKLMDQQQPQYADNNEDLLQIQASFGYTNEELTKTLYPMALEGKEPIGSMGYDGPLAVLSDRPQLLFNYFKQRFAQVTNPPIDAIREELVTSVEVLIGSDGNLLQPRPEDYKKIRLKTPVLLNIEMNRLRHLQTNEWKSAVISTLFSVRNQKDGLERAIHTLLQMAVDEIERGCNILILSDQGVNSDYAAIPSLLAVSAVHHHLIRTGLRSKASIVIESGEPREVHHFAALLGYGANAIYPYLVYTSLSHLIEKEGKVISVSDASANYVKSVTNGILKTMSKMGISAIQSYIGAQIFEAVGISTEVIQKYFPCTASQIGGLTLADIAKEIKMRHQQAFTAEDINLESGSDFQWRYGGEPHLFNPNTIHTLQQACRTGRYDLYQKYSQVLEDEMANQSTLRSLLEFKHKRKAIPIEEVEPVEAIFRRFKTGAMSYGSISQEAHEAIAIAMNRIGGKSNSGEGGEDAERFSPLANGDSLNSRIKQVASGRFGVTSHYLINCDEIQIKMAQGAKPGEGGQLAGHKVTPSVAKTRGSTPGIELISPPPHHDIYSIEDLSQLIYDLKNANPQARINVKLVSESGVGTIAAGVAKAKADVILISGYDGGTGAASRSSIKHTGIPWELGLADAHQTLMLNGLRNRVRLETDGKLMNGRDVVIAAMLGAEEFGFSTLPLIVLGCVMMRVCHLDTCPVGIATQNPELRRKMMGTPENIVNLMCFIAQEVRECMAELGFRTMEELIGQTDLLKRSEKGNWKAQTLDLSALFYQQKGSKVFQQAQDHELAKTLDSRELLPICEKAWQKNERVHVRFHIRNTDRAAGTLLGSEISRRFGAQGLPDHSVRIDFRGSAGQSFGAFIPSGVTLSLEGDANDYAGKGLSGGKIIMFPSIKAAIPAEQNIIMGNAAFYGATAGEAFINGKAGERFCVRNSGANVVVEGVGDHGCEYMTGGRVVILGEVGKNFAAGMFGGIAYIFKQSNDRFHEKCNQEHIVIENLKDPDEIAFVKKLVDRQWRYTESYAANQIIQNWEKNVSQFVRVIPKEYKRILDSAHFMQESALQL